MWDFNYLLVEIAMLIGVWLLYQSAPDVIQKITLVLIGIAASVYVAADVAAIAGLNPVWPIRLVASRIEHFGVGVYIFRQVWIKSEICRHLKSSNSPVR